MLGSDNYTVRIYGCHINSKYWRRGPQVSHSRGRPEGLTKKMKEYLWWTK